MADSFKDKTVSELEATICRLELQLSRIDHSLLEFRRDRAQIASELNNANQALAKRKKSEATLTAPSVSNHALLRYAERVLGIDVQALEAQILTPANRAAITAGAKKISSEGISLIVKDGVVVTVTT